MRVRKVRWGSTHFISDLASAFPIAPSYTPDLTAALPGPTGGAVTPNPMDTNRRDTARRKQTLLTLLDALNELNRDDDLGGFGMSALVAAVTVLSLIYLDVRLVATGEP